jgi:hypothetical protein
MDSAIRRLRSAAQQLAHGKAPRAIRYPAPFRAAVVRIALAHQERGGGVAKLAHALGLTTPTLTRWLEGPPMPRLRPVTIAAAALVEESGPARPVLITPQGVRVEGLDRTALIAVLRALA